MLDKKILKVILKIAAGILGFYAAGVAAADPAQGQDIAGIVATVTKTFSSIGQLMTGAAYLSGFGLVIAAIFKFKQHKDNPQQATMGTAITILLVGVALIFLPTIIEPAGSSIFGTGAKAGGFTGTNIETVPGGGGTGGGG